MSNRDFISRTGFMFILSSPSGAGKTTISKYLLQKDENLIISVSVTTRPKRPDEADGMDYHFVSKDEFFKMAEKDEFIEHAQVFGHYYGTPKKTVKEALAAGRDVLFDIDWQGTRQLAAKAREDLASVFILPPSMQELENRLKKRGQDTEDVLRQRMDKANAEISHWDEYDYVLINNQLEKSIDEVTAILHAERLRRKRQQGLSEFVKGLLRG